MRTTGIGLLIRTLFWCTIVSTSTSAEAQGDIDKPINMIVPFSAGGSIDIVGRILAQKLGQQMGVSVVVENKTGFSGNIGAQYAAHAAADGSNLVMASLTSYALNNKLLGPKRMGYDLLHDFKVVAVVGRMPEVLIINHNIPAKNIPELVAYLKKHPGEDAFGSSGAGSIGHIAGELLKLRAGVNITHVPYRGSTPAVMDIMSGHIQMMFSTTPAFLADLSSGKLRAIGVASNERAAILPNVPTLAEQGLPGIDVTSFPGIMVAANTPEDIVARLNAGFEKVLIDPDVGKKLAEQGVEVVLNNPKQAAQLFTDEVNKWSRLIDQTHIVVTQLSD
jgi:tripartite-type tricarboxylate transporter receptor subunit TctC